MNCPFCHHPESQVIDTRQSTYNQIGGIRRRRQCSQCNERFSSFEMTINDLEGVEPTTLDGLLQQIIKLFKEAPRTPESPLVVPTPTNGHKSPVVKSSKPATKKLTSNDIKAAMRRARQQLARELDDLDASEFDDEDFD